MASESAASGSRNDRESVLALPDMSNRPTQLKGWTAVDGDPCQQSWTGIECCNLCVMIGGNLDKIPNGKNNITPAVAKSSAIEKNPSRGRQQHKKGEALRIISLRYGGTAIIITLLALAIVVHFKRNHAAQLESFSSSNSSNGGDHII